MSAKTYSLDWFSFYWLAWILAFLGPELYWLAVNSRNTLSENIWSIEALNKAQPFDFPMWTATHWIVALMVWSLFLWLSLHFPFGLLR